MKGNERENIRLSNVSDTRRKSKKRKINIEKCGSSNCYITMHDVKIEWVQCDTCNKWYHTMCEMLTPLEEMSINSDAYMCVECGCSNDDINQEKMNISKDCCID